MPVSQRDPPKKRVFQEDQLSSIRENDIIKELVLTPYWIKWKKDYIFNEKRYALHLRHASLQNIQNFI